MNIEQKIEKLIEEANTSFNWGSDKMAGQKKLQDYDWQLKHLRDTLDNIEHEYKNGGMTQDHYLVARHNLATEMGQLANQFRPHIQKHNTTSFNVM